MRHFAPGSLNFTCPVENKKVIEIWNSHRKYIVNNKQCFAINMSDFKVYQKDFTYGHRDQVYIKVSDRNNIISISI